MKCGRIVSERDSSCTTTNQTGGLSLSWLFLEDTVIHIPVKEEEKGAGDAVGRKLTIGDKTYQVRTDWRCLIVGVELLAC